MQAQILHVGATAALGRQIAQDRQSGLLARVAALGFDTVGAVALARPSERAQIAQEFIQSWHPPCNDGHGALAGLMGLPAPLAQGSVVASDAFFPFADGLITAAEAGATALIQPGGSMRDDEVIAAADPAGLAMVFTDMRHFNH